MHATIEHNLSVYMMRGCQICWIRRMGLFKVMLHLSKPIENNGPINSLVIDP